MSLSSSSSICMRSHQMLPSAVKRTCRILISCAPVFPAAMPSFGGELATTIPDARLSIRSFLVNIILPIRLVRRTAYFPRWYNGVLRCNAICTGPPPAVRGPARASAPALCFLGVSTRGSAFNRAVPAKSLCKGAVRLRLPCALQKHDFHFQCFLPPFSTQNLDFMNHQNYTKCSTRQWYHSRL